MGKEVERTGAEPPPWPSLSLLPEGLQSLPAAPIIAPELYDSSGLPGWIAQDAEQGSSVGRIQPQERGLGAGF